MAKMQYFFLDHNEKLLFVRDDATYHVVDEADYTLDASFPINDDKPIRDGMKIGFYDIDNNLVFYDIRKAEEDIFENVVDIVSAEHSAMAELLDEIIVDTRPSKTTAGAAVASALASTRWSLGVAETTDAQSCRFWYSDVWSSLQKIVSVWGCELSFRWDIDDSGIAGRYVDVKQHPGKARGKRFDTRKDVSALNIIYDDSEVYTALYGRGRGEEITGNDGDTNYGRKLSFADVVWSKANGDPCDKPAGQEWVEDVEATAAYGRSGRKRCHVVNFDDCTDPEELLFLTWNALQEVNKPKISIRGTFSDFERIWGYSHEAVRMNDIVAVISGKSIEIETRVVDIRRNYLDPDQTQVSIGNDVLTIADINARNSRSIAEAKEAAAYGNALVSKNPSLLQGFIDTMATQILSTGTNFYTDEEDGSFIFENNQRSAAVKITGNGIIIANRRISDKWQWTTAMNGDGIVANTITSGVLQAQLIRIFGNELFFWDALNIVCSNPTNQNQQIRFGCYDGTHYGIGFTQDGGQTWASALDFAGAHISTEERYSSVTSSNSSVSFAAGSDGIVAADTTMYSYIIAFTGHNRVIPNVSTITGLPSGMTATKQAARADGSVPIKITVAAGSNLGSSGNISGQLTVHVTSPIETDVLIDWVKVNAGANGANGQDGTNGKDGKDGAPGTNGRDGEDGADGNNGINSATVILYCRSSSAPTAPAGPLTYRFADGYISGSYSGWYTTIPDGSDPCYSIFAFIASTEATAQITSWSTPTVAIRNGADGAAGAAGANGKDGKDGKDGTSVTILGSYETEAALRAAHPTGQAGDSYIVAGDLYVWTSNDWQNVGTIQGPAGADGADGKDGKDGTNGTNGTNGRDGTNGTSSYLYVRYSANASGSSMTTTPTATTKYIGIAVTNSATAPTSYKSYTWSKYKGEDGVNGADGKDGINGTDGEDGLSRADVYLYIRSDGVPAKPAADLTYTFLTGAFSQDTAPWSPTVPASNGNPCYVISYLAIANTSTVTIHTTDWNGPVLFVQDGVDGQDGRDGKDGKDGENGKDGVGTKTYYGSIEPSPLEYDLLDGDIWFNTANDNKMYRWNEPTTAWVSVSDMSIDRISNTLIQAVADLDIAENHIDAIIGASYITNDGLQNAITTLKQELIANEESITAKFSKQVSDLDTSIRSDIETMIRASGDGIEIGRSDSNFKTILSNDRLSFIQVDNGTSVEVAYISDHKLYITDAQVTNELAIGSGAHKLFKWRRTTNGLILVYQS